MRLLSPHRPSPPLASPLRSCIILHITAAIFPVFSIPWTLFQVPCSLQHPNALHVSYLIFLACQLGSRAQMLVQKKTCDNWPSGHCQRGRWTAELSCLLFSSGSGKPCCLSAGGDFPGTHTDFIVSGSLTAADKSGSKHQRIQELSGEGQTDGQIAWLHDLRCLKGSGLYLPTPNKMHFQLQEKSYS